MLGIKNIDLITSTVNDFSIGDLHFVIDFSYSIEIDTVAVFDIYNKSILVVKFVLVPKHNESKYIVTIHFKKLGSLRLSTNGVVIQLSGFEILDITDRGWESINYLVRDFENEEDFKFYCNEIEVVAIEEVDLFVG